MFCCWVVWTVYTYIGYSSLSVISFWNTFFLFNSPLYGAEQFLCKILSVGQMLPHQVPMKTVVWGEGLISLILVNVDWGMNTEILPWAALALVLTCDPKLFLAAKSSVSMCYVQTRPQTTWRQHGDSWHTNTHWGVIPGGLLACCRAQTNPWLRVLMGSFITIYINPKQVYYHPADSCCWADSGSTHFQKCFTSTWGALPMQVGRQGSNERGSRLTGPECCLTGSECPKHVTCGWAQKWVFVTCTLGSLTLLPTHPMFTCRQCDNEETSSQTLTHFRNQACGTLWMWVEFQPCVDKPVLLKNMFFFKVILNWTPETMYS